MHLIFDCDGVLIDSEYVAVHVMLRMLKPLGYETDFQHYSDTFTGMLDTEIIRYLGETENLDFPPNFYQEVEKERDKAFEEELAPIAGMPELVRSLSLPKSVVSNSHVAHVVKGLDLCNLREAFGDRIYSSEHVKNPKPHPDVYLHALKAQNLRTENVLVVEDSSTGVQAAKGAGCTVIGFLGGKHISAGHGEKLKALGADYLASTPTELQSLLHRLG